MSYSFLFVCTGNICRSPTAEAIFRERVRSANLPFQHDSCGTHGYHIGDGADTRSVGVAKNYGVDMSDLTARKLTQSDFERFDYLIAMDEGHARIMKSQCPGEYQDKIKLLLDYTEEYHGMDVPDPYYGSLSGFDEVYKIIEAGVDAMLRSIR
jgi:protein-tyrosine phosphatase